MDLPNISAGTTANLDTVTTYADVTETYDTIGGSFFDQNDSFNRHTIMVGQDDSDNGLSSDKIYALDLSDRGLCQIGPAHISCQKTNHYRYRLDQPLSCDG